MAAKKLTKEDFPMFRKMILFGNKEVGVIVANNAGVLTNFKAKNGAEKDEVYSYEKLNELLQKNHMKFVS